LLLVWFAVFVLFWLVAAAVQVLLPISASDEDGESVTFSILSGNTGGALRFSAPSSSGTYLDRVYVEVNTASLDYESLSGVGFR
jgi:hypothetical protein